MFMAFAADSPRWASKENVAALGAWAFDQLGVQRVTAVVKKNNKRARKFDEGVGFRVEGKIRKAEGNTDFIIYGLLKDEHKEWLRTAFNGRTKQPTNTTV
jgi:RimJ/RimL family protein N-acetyltransferase